jgi:ABC-type nitrate/sulfonate/bicarbonate transport system substrate-binding protein
MKKLLLLVLFFSFLNASNLQKTSIQLMWLDQFEFAGFYIAKEKGFYEDVGLDVELKKFDSSMDLTKKVLDKEADFGLNSSSLLIDKAKGKDIYFLQDVDGKPQGIETFKAGADLIAKTYEVEKGGTYYLYASGSKIMIYALTVDYRSSVSWDAVKTLYVNTLGLSSFRTRIDR